MKESDIGALREAGNRALEEYDFKRALKIGQRLKELRHTSGFEVMALACAGEENLKKAVAILEEGVSLAPSVWRLWQLLGNYYSDMGRFDESLAAYRSALDCPETAPSSIYLNIAILMNRRHDYPAALEGLDRVTDEDLRLHALAVRVNALIALSRNEEVLGLTADLRPPDEPTDPEKDSLARILTASATACWKTSGDREKAMRFLKEALEWDKGCGEALWLLREMDGEISPKALYYRILVEGVWPEPFEEEKSPPGFFTSYDVVADDGREALKYIRRVEPAEIGPTLRINEAKVLERRPNDPKGVYTTSPYMFFEET